MGVSDLARLADLGIGPASGFTPLADVLRAADDGPPALLRPTGPNWADFRAGIPFRRPEVGRILRTLSRAYPGHVVLLHGDAASGKTTIARQVGYELALAGRAVLHAELPTLVERFGSLDRAIREFVPAADHLGARPLLTIEDLHRAGRRTSLEALEVVATALRQTRASGLTGGADFVLATRQGPGEDGSDDAGLFWDAAFKAMCALGRDSVAVLNVLPAKAKPPWESTPTYAELVAKLAPHLWRARWEAVEHREPALSELDTSHCAALIEEAGGDLWLLAWMLAGHDGSLEREFTRELALEHVRAYLTGQTTPSLADRCRLSTSRAADEPDLTAAAILLVAAMPSGLAQRRTMVCDVLGGPGGDIEATLEALARDGEVVEEEFYGQSGVRIAHPALAQLYVDALRDHPTSEFVAARLVAWLNAAPRPRKQAYAALWSLGRLGGELAVATLLPVLGEGLPAARIAATALGWVGPSASPAVPALVEALTDASRHKRLAAAEALGSIGPAAGSAAAALVRALADAEAPVARAAEESLARIGEPAVVPLVEALSDGDARVRVASASALGRMGDHAASAVLALVSALHDPDPELREAAAEALASIGPSAADAVPALARAQADADYRVDRAATRALGAMGAPAVPALMAILAGGRGDSLWDVNEALARIGEPAVASLIAALEARPVGGAHRNRISSALGAIGGPAVPELARLLSDPRAGVRTDAARALCGALWTVGLRIDAPPVAEAVKALTDAGEYVRACNVAALGGAAPLSGDVIRAVAARLNDRDLQVRWQAASALERLGSAAAPAVPALVEALPRGCKHVHSGIIDALASIGRAAVPALVQVLGSESELLCVDAAQALGRMGETALPAAPSLVRALTDERARVRFAAAVALRQIEPAEVGNLADGLRSSGEPVRAPAVLDLMVVGDRGVDAVSLALDHWQQKVSPEAIRALVDIGGPAVPALLEALRDGNCRVRRAAAEVLARFGGAAEPAVPALAEALTDPDGRVRRAAAKALRRAGAPAAAAMPALRKLLDDPLPKVRGAAQLALDELARHAPEPGQRPPLPRKSPVGGPT